MWGRENRTAYLYQQSNENSHSYCLRTSWNDFWVKQIFAKVALVSVVNFYILKSFHFTTHKKFISRWHILTQCYNQWNNELTSWTNWDFLPSRKEEDDKSSGFHIPLASLRSKCEERESHSVFIPTSKMRIESLTASGLHETTFLNHNLVKNPLWIRDRDHCQISVFSPHWSNVLFWNFGPSVEGQDGLGQVGGYI